MNYNIRAGMAGTHGVATVVCAGLVLLSALPPARALTLTNNDEVAYVMTIVENGQERQVTIEPGQEIEELCAEECVVRPDNGEEYEFLAGDVVVIEGGALFLDEPAGGLDHPDQASPSGQ